MTSKMIVPLVFTCMLLLIGGSSGTLFEKILPSFKLHPSHHHHGHQNHGHVDVGASSTYDHGASHQGSVSGQHSISIGSEYEGEGHGASSNHGASNAGTAQIPAGGSHNKKFGLNIFAEIPNPLEGVHAALDDFAQKIASKHHNHHNHHINAQINHESNFGTGIQGQGAHTGSSHLHAHQNNQLGGKVVAESAVNQGPQVTPGHHGTSGVHLSGSLDTGSQLPLGPHAISGSHHAGSADTGFQSPSVHHGSGAVDLSTPTLDIRVQAPQHGHSGLSHQNSHVNSHQTSVGFDHQSSGHAIVQTEAPSAYVPQHEGSLNIQTGINHGSSSEHQTSNGGGLKAEHGYNKELSFKLPSLFDFSLKKEHSVSDGLAQGSPHHHKLTHAHHSGSTNLGAQVSSSSVAQAPTIAVEPQGTHSQTHGVNVAVNYGDTHPATHAPQHEKGISWGFNLGHSHHAAVESSHGGSAQTSSAGHQALSHGTYVSSVPEVSASSDVYGPSVSVGHTGSFNGHESSASEIGSEQSLSGKKGITAGASIHSEFSLG